MKQPSRSPSSLAAKIRYLLEIADSLSQVPEYMVTAVTPARFPTSFDGYFRRKERRHRRGHLQRTVEETARKWINGKVSTPQAAQRDLLVSYFTEEIFGKYLSQKSRELRPEWFRDDITAGMFSRYFPDDGSYFNIQFNISQSTIDTSPHRAKALALITSNSQLYAIHGLPMP